MGISVNTYFPETPNTYRAVTQGRERRENGAYVAVLFQPRAVVVWKTRPVVQSVLEE